MESQEKNRKIEEMKRIYPDKFASENQIFIHIRRGKRIFNGIGSEMLPYFTFLAREQGLLGFFSEVLVQNRAMRHFFEKMGYEIERRREEGVYELKIVFQ